MTVRVLCCFTFAALVLAQGQAQNTTGRFEVASVRESLERGARTYRITPQSLDLTGETLAYAVSQAFEIPSARVIIPSAVRTGMDKLYDFHARTAVPATRTQILAMLRELLHERFGLVARVEHRPGKVWNLAVARGGSQLARSAGEFDGEVPRMTIDTVEGTGVRISQLALLLSARLERPVLDRTRLDGLYDFKLHIQNLEEHPTLDTKRAGEYWTGSSIFRDIQEQLGLRLEAGDGMSDFVVIEALAPLSEN